MCVPLAWAGPLLVGLILTISLPPWSPLQAPTERPQCTVKSSYSQCPPALQQVFTDRPKSQMRDSWWEEVSPAKLPKLVPSPLPPSCSHTARPPPTPAPVPPCALSSAQHVPAAPRLLTRPPRLSPGGGAAARLPAVPAQTWRWPRSPPAAGKTEYTHIHTHTCLCTHALSPHVHTHPCVCTRTLPRAGGDQ